MIYESFFDYLIEACKEQLSYGTTARAELYAVMDEETRFRLDGGIVSTVEPLVVGAAGQGDRGPPVSKHLDSQLLDHPPAHLLICTDRHHRHRGRHTCSASR